MDWKNVLDENGKEIKCDYPTKEKIFNYKIENFTVRVDEILLEIAKVKEDSVKN